MLITNSTQNRVDGAAAIPQSGAAEQRVAFRVPLQRRLEQDALRELRLRRWHSALALIDARISLSTSVDAHHFLMRAFCLERLGDVAAARRDVQRAIDTDPFAMESYRVALRIGTPTQRHSAAQELLRAADPNVAISAATGIVAAAGGLTWQQVTGRSNTIRIVADRHADYCIEVSGAVDVTIAPTLLYSDETHEMVEIDLDPHFTGYQVSRVFFKEKNHVCVEGVLLASLQEQFENPSFQTRTCVIIPVYTGLEATRRCFISVIGARQDDNSVDVIIVNDCSPDPEIQGLCRQFAETHARVHLLQNEANQGFVRSINRALSCVESGNVVLLNSDTVVPTTFFDTVDSLIDAHPDTVFTPLSNNGEIASLFASVSNHHARTSAVISLNDLMAKPNGSDLCPALNGVGFCIVIPDSVRENVGPLSECFDAGYFEEVDFCLRAEALGFSSAIAPSLVIYHQGGQSFGDRKRPLVERNRRVLSRRHPSFEQRARGFDLSDPLRPTRAKLAWTLVRHADVNTMTVVTRYADLKRISARIFGTERANEDVVALALIENAGAIDVYLRGFANGIAFDAVDYALDWPSIASKWQPRGAAWLRRTIEVVGTGDGLVLQKLAKEFGLCCVARDFQTLTLPNSFTNESWRERVPPPLTSRLPMLSASVFRWLGPPRKRS